MRGEFTKKFNVCCSRVAFWESMVAHLAMFEGAVYNWLYSNS